MNDEGVSTMCSSPLNLPSTVKKGHNFFGMPLQRASILLMKWDKASSKFKDTKGGHTWSIVWTGHIGYPVVV